MSKFKFGLTLALIIGYIGNFSFAKELNLDSYINDLDQNLKFDSTNISVKSIIDKYCESVLQNTLKYDETLSYKANESAFVYILCTNINKKYGDKFDDIKDYFTGTSFKELGISKYSSDRKINYCSPTRTNLNNCNIPYQIPNIFKKIINEYTNIKQSSMYGITEKIENNSQIEDFANQFGRNHFSTEICNSKKTGINYSKSCNIIKSYIQSSSKILDNLKILNTDYIYKKKDNFIYNGIIKHSDVLFIDFTNTVYNELFFLRLFTDYYNLTIANNYNIISKDSSDAIKQMSEFNNEFMRIQKSIAMTTRNLRDIYISFPLHIGLVMYYEDVLKLGKELEGVSNPIYNLYDKFRNVQKPSK